MMEEVLTGSVCLCRKLAEEKYQEIQNRRRELRSRHFEKVSLDVLNVRKDESREPNLMGSCLMKPLMSSLAAQRF